MNSGLTFLHRWTGAVWRSALMLVILVTAGTTLQVLSDSTQNKAHTTQVLHDAVKTGPLHVPGFPLFGAWLSNFSECIGSSISVNRADPGFWRSLESNAILWQPPKKICQSFADYMDAPEGSDVKWFAYSRYWHGYRIVTQTVLSFFSYETLRLFCLAGLALAFAVWTIFQARLLGPYFALGFAAALLLCTDIALAFLTPTHAISLTALFLASALISQRSISNRFVQLIPYCFIAGAIYNYFDFLYNPDLLVLLTGISIALIGIHRKQELGSLTGHILSCQLAVLVGYFSMWVSKWLLVASGRALFGQNPGLPISDFSRWIAGGDSIYHPLSTLVVLSKTAWRFGENALVLPAFAGLGLVCAAWLIRSGRWRTVAAFGLVVLLPLGMLEAKATHTIVHGSFTFRSVPAAISLIALCLLWSTPGKAIMAIKRHPNDPSTPPGQT